MGNLCTTPFSEEKKKKKNRHKLVVLKDPTGHDISERYDLGRELGRGEFGITYLCTELDTGEKYACKSISKKKLRTSVAIEDVRTEVEIMKHMPRHPNIVSLKDTYEDDFEPQAGGNFLGSLNFQRTMMYPHPCGSEIRIEDYIMERPCQSSPSRGLEGHQF